VSKKEPFLYGNIISNKDKP